MPLTVQLWDWSSKIYHIPLVKGALISWECLKQLRKNQKTLCLTAYEVAVENVQGWRTFSRIQQ